MDEQFSNPEAVAIDGDRVVSVGSLAQVSDSLVGAEVIDLKGGSLIPGLNDSHCHLLNMGMALQMVDCHTESLTEMLVRVRARAEESASGDFVLGRGWDQNLWREGRYPTCYDLDEAGHGQPVVLTRVCGHALVASSRALELAHIDRYTSDPDGGHIDRDEQGYPTGVIRERAMDLIWSAVPDADAAAYRRALDLAARHAASCGITSVQTNDAYGDFRPVASLYAEYLASAEAVALRVRLLSTLDADTIDRDAEAIREFQKTVDETWLNLGTLKAMSDGSLGARTAALVEPYSDDPGNNGIAYYSQAELDRVVAAGHNRGFQVAIHAIGDRAARMVTEAISKAQKGDTSLRHRLIHGQVLSRDIINTIKALGMTMDIQPKFITTDWAWAHERVGEGRLAYAYAWRTLVEAGIICAGGSDSPVEPIAPLLGIYAAVTRQDMDGRPAGGWMAEQRLRRSDALSLFTTNAAYVEFMEDQKGSITPGKLADLAVLDEDLMSVPPEEIKDLTVKLTLCGGRESYRLGI
jgi:predicted amidohydrolase YtcJ